MEHFREWLFQNRQSILLESNELMLLLDSLGKNTVAISACGVFTVTYSMVGAVRADISLLIYQPVKL